MQEYIDKAAVLIEALPYIQRFKGKKILIKLGGSVITEEDYYRGVVRDVVFMRTVGMQPIIVHGGGKNITSRLTQSGIESRFVHGFRYTDAATMEIVSDVLRNDVSRHILDLLKQMGVEAEAFNGIDHDCIKCVKKTTHMGSAIDLGFVGNITDIHTDEMMKACQEGRVPVVAPLATDASGQPYNINADIMAGELSKRIHVDKMVYISDIPGILKDVNDPASLFTSLKQSQVEELIRQGIIAGGMIPKIEACLQSLEAGSRKTHIIDGRLKHSLLLEIFTDKGVGTEILHG